MSKFLSAAKIGGMALTGWGIRDFLKRNKKAAWIIVAVVVANEIRGLAVVYAIVKAWFA